MGMATQFNLVAQEYDQNRRKFIPCFDEFYQGVTAFIAANIAAPKRILDLGAGTGLLSAFWLEHFPASEYVLVDVAEEMLRLARERFTGKGNVSCMVQDYAEALPDGPFDVIISALSVHHLEDADKERLFARVYEKLPDGGLFVNHDQFRAGQPEMDAWFDSHWQRQLRESGLTEHDFALWRERQKLDRECSVEEETAMLRRIGFSVVQCVYSCRKFAVLAVIK